MVVEIRPELPFGIVRGEPRGSCPSRAQCAVRSQTAPGYAFTEERDGLLVSLPMFLDHPQRLVGQMLPRNRDNIFIVLRSEL